MAYRVDPRLSSHHELDPGADLVSFRWVLYGRRGTRVASMDHVAQSAHLWDGGAAALALSGRTARAGRATGRGGVGWDQRRLRGGRDVVCGARRPAQPGHRRGGLSKAAARARRFARNLYGTGRALEARYHARGMLEWAAAKGVLANGTDPAQRHHELHGGVARVGRVGHADVDRPTVAGRLDPHAVLGRKLLAIGDVVRRSEEQADRVDQIVVGAHGNELEEARIDVGLQRRRTRRDVVVRELQE